MVSCSLTKDKKEQKLAIVLINSTHEDKRVTFEERLQNGKLKSPYALNITIKADSKIKKLIDPKIYKIKVWNELNCLSGHIKDFTFHLHDEDTHEHPYYLDISLHRDYALTDLDFIYQDTSQVDFTNFDIFKIYDGRTPFEIGKTIRYHDIIFLEDKIPHMKPKGKKLYCAYPIPKNLDRSKVHLYLEEQIRVHYEE